MVLFCMIFLFARLYSDNSSDLYLLDTIEAVVYNQKNTEIVTKSDLDRPSLGGEIQSLSDIIFERLVFIDAKKQGIPQDEEGLEAYLRAIQKEHDLTDEGLKNIFTAAGYLYEEGREQLQMMQTNKSMIDFKIRSSLIVPRKEVIAYYQAHPKVQEATYVVRRAFFPFSSAKTKAQQKKELSRFSIKNQSSIKKEKNRTKIAIEWSELFPPIKQSDIAEEKSFIISMHPGDVSLPVETFDGFELFRLQEKTEERLLTLDERYHEIIIILQQPKYEELLRTYRDRLFNNAAIIYFSHPN